MTRPVRLIFSAPFVAAAVLMLLASTSTPAQAAEPTSGSAAYTTYVAKWQQPLVSVWSNWNAAICTGAYSNPTGDPTPPLSAPEMQRILTAVIAQLNDEIGGGLTLVDAGAGQAGAHCGESEAPAGISVGWSPLETGIAGMAPLTSDGDTAIGAGVVLNPILVCQDAAEWLEFVMLHEMMHALGIAHSEVPDSVMYERASCGQTAILHADDVAALNAHYPAREAGTTTTAATSAAPALSQVHVDLADAALSPREFIARLAATGCEARVLTVTTAGRSRAYVVGAPTFVNASFPSSLAPMTPVSYRCEN